MERICGMRSRLLDLSLWLTREVVRWWKATGAAGSRRRQIQFLPPLAG